MFLFHRNVCPSLVLIVAIIIVRQRDQGIYGLFRNLRALGCSVPSAARVLLRAPKVSKLTVDPVGQGV